MDLNWPVLLHHTFERSAEALGPKTALVAGGERVGYAELARRADAFAEFLRAHGVGRGDRVALFLDNGVEFVVALYGTLRAGAVFMPINPLTKRDKLTYLLNDSRASCLVSEKRAEPVYADALADAPSVSLCIIAGEGIDLKANGRLTASFEKATTGDGRTAAAAIIDQDLAAIIYTSGSTGDPKGVMLTHRNMLTALQSVGTYLGLREDDVILCALPLAFDYGLYQLLMGLAVGGRVVLERSFAFPARILEIMQRERVTVFPGVPTMFSILVNMESLARYDLGALRMITNTAAALSESHIAALRRLFPQATLFSMYGLTECKRVSYLPPDQLDRRPTSVGRGMPNEEVYLVDEDGRRLPNGGTGELVIRGSHVMRGYWGKPDATVRRLKPGPHPGEQVLYSGDIFRTDEEGYLYFVGRKDDIIKSRGEKVSPKEVENVLYRLDGVVEAAVVGVPDPLLGQAVKAFVVLGAGRRYSERDVMQHCLAHLENFMVPKYVSIVDALPKTDTGKIKKTGLA